METRKIEYEQDDTRLEGLAVIPDGASNAPGVLVAHDWGGRNAFAEDSARRLAELGYVALAVDMYGEGRTGETMEEKMALMGPIRADRGLLMARMTAALDALKAMPEVDASRTGAIGFCFGGLCVLDLARSGADVGGVVSFHGLLDAASDVPAREIKAKVLVLHGYQDPMAKPEAVVAFGEEMTQAKADWQLHAYGTAVHAFTNPEANDAAFGTVYDETTARRAYRSMQDFFGDIFG